MIKVNKKGFTLIELLAIILILGIIAAIVAPNIGKQISSSEKKQQKILYKRIENASKIYASKYYADKLIDEDEKTNVSFSIDDLLQDGVLTLSDSECSNRNIEIKFYDGEIQNEVEIKEECNIE